MRALRVFVLLSATVVAACGGGGGEGGGAPVVGDLPPLGSAWFGSGFEAGTLKLQGKTTTIKQGTPVVVIGRFLSAKAPSEMVVQLQRGGNETARIPVPDGSPSDVMGVDLTPQNLGPGTYLVNFVDKNRRTMASGTLVVTP